MALGRQVGVMLLWTALLTTLTACGFHLRGATALHSGLTTLTLQDASPATAVAAELRRTLTAQGTVLTDDAPLILQLHQEQYGKRVLSVDSQGRAQEYGLSYTLSYSLRDRDGRAWIGRESISANRDLRFDASAVLGSSGEEDQLRAEMRQDAINRLLTRLSRARPPAQ